MLNLNRGRRKKLPGMNLTPLIDVIFILLIFFMIATQFKQNSLPLDLPRSSGEKREDSNAVVLAISGDGEISLRGEIVTREQLKNALYDLKQNKPDLALVLACDRNLFFETVVQILEEVKSAGIEKIGIRHDQMDS